MVDLLAQVVIKGSHLQKPFSGNLTFVLGRLPIVLRVLHPPVFDARHQFMFFPYIDARLRNTSFAAFSIESISLTGPTARVSLTGPTAIT